MYNFSTQGKHFMKLITTSSLSLSSLRAKTFTVRITVAILTSGNPWVYGISVTYRECIAVSGEAENKESHVYLKNSNAKLSLEMLSVRRPRIFNFGAEIIEMCMLSLYGPSWWSVSRQGAFSTMSSCSLSASEPWKYMLTYLSLRALILNWRKPEL